MPDQTSRRYAGVQNIPLVEYLRLYYGHLGWSATWADSAVLSVETINAQWYRLHLADGRIRKVSYAAKITVRSNEDPPDGTEQ